MNLFISLRSELVKSKRTSVWYLCLIPAVIAAIFSFFDSSASYKIADIQRDPWNMHLMGMGGLAFNMMILPGFLILTCTLLAQLEYRNQTWKQVYVSPQPLLNIFLSKFLIIQLMLLVVFILTLVLMVISLLAVDYFKTNLLLLEHELNWENFLIFYARIYITVLAISAFQFWLALLLKNFIAPIVIGLCLWFTGVIMMDDENQWAHANKYPYSYPMLNFFSKTPSDRTTILWSSVAYTTSFLVFGFKDFKRKEKRS